MTPPRVPPLVGPPNPADRNKRICQGPLCEIPPWTPPLRGTPPDFGDSNKRICRGPHPRMTPPKWCTPLKSGPDGTKNNSLDFKHSKNDEKTRLLRGGYLSADRCACSRFRDPKNYHFSVTHQTRKIDPPKRQKSGPWNRDYYRDPPPGGGSHV